MIAHRLTHKQSIVPFLIIALLFLVVAALPGCSAPQNSPQAVYALKSTYATGLKAAVEYRHFAPCTRTPRPVPCSDAAVVKQLQDGDDRAYKAIQELESGAIAYDAAKRIVDGFNAQAEKARAQ